MKYLKNPAILYTLMWCLYWCQGVLYSSGGIISRFCLLFIIILSIFYTFLFFKTYKVDDVNLSLFRLLIIVSIYGIFAFIVEGTSIKGMTEDTPTINWFKSMYMSILPFFCYTYFAHKKYITQDILINMVPVFIVVAILAYYNGQMQMVQLVYELQGTMQDEITNNAGYTVLSLLPMMIILHKKTLYQYVGALICAIFILMAFKRGAIMICALILLFMIIKSFMNASMSRKVLIVTISVLFMLALYHIVNSLFETSDYIIKRIEDTRNGYSSGRDDIFSTLWKTFLNDDNIFTIIFGHGVWATTKFTWTAAHNDWLEFLIDMGFIGCYFLFQFFISLFRKTRDRGLSEFSRTGFLLLFTVLFSRTFFSMSISDMTFFEAALFGLCITDNIE